MADPSLADAAAELYVVPPGEFVAERNARAKQVEDRELAEQIRTLRKPSIAAWVVNVFARERADRLGQALQLAAELREAQEDLDARTLSKLGRDRRALTSQLAREAASLASSGGARITDSTVEAVQQTITAAFFDPDAATAVASGRLVRELEPSSEFPLDFDATVGGGAPERTPPPSPPADEVRERRERKEAEKAVHAAERDLERAKREQAKADKEREAAASRADRLEAEVEELEAQLARARAEAEKARAAVEETTGRAAEAAEGVRSAESAVEEARSALERRGRA
ncbi:transposase [Microbacterium abyssi]|uniref:transposase n=1 Tax=Microbacterium abyssi TaxID=2782166 RepID=UPI00188757D1|nr:transposase [Microbacterium sp. A18JL241]